MTAVLNKIYLRYIKYQLNSAIFLTCREHRFFQQIRAPKHTIQHFYVAFLLYKANSKSEWTQGQSVIGHNSTSFNDPLQTLQSNCCYRLSFCSLFHSHNIFLLFFAIERTLSFTFCYRVFIFS